MEKTLKESVEWSLDKNLEALYNENIRGNGSSSTSSQCLTIVAPYREDCGIALMENDDFSTFRAYGVFLEKDFLENYLDGLIAPLSAHGQRIVYYARNSL